MKVYCHNITKNYINFAKEFGVSPIEIATLASIYLGEHPDKNEVDYSTVKDLIKNREYIKKEEDEGVVGIGLPARYVFVDNASTGDYSYMQNDFTCAIQKDITVGEIRDNFVHNFLPALSQNQKEDVENKFGNNLKTLQEKINDVIDNKVITSYFLVFYAVEKYKKSGSDVGRLAESEKRITAALKAVDTCEKFKESDLYKEQVGQQKSKLQKTLDQLNLLKKINEQHISFDPKTHIYFFDGKPIDISVSQQVRNKNDSFEDEKDPSVAGYEEISTSIGNWVDAIGRDFFMGKIKKNADGSYQRNGRKIVQYKDKDKQEETDEYACIQHFEFIKGKLNEKFGKDYKVITDESFLRLAASFTENGQRKSIAGTMDMVVVDSEGIVHLFDFKTSRGEKEMGDNKIVKYSKQLALYKAMIEANCPDLKGKVKIEGLLVFHTQYDAPKGSRPNETGVVEYALGYDENLYERPYILDGERNPDDFTKIKSSVREKQLYLKDTSKATILPIYTSINRDNFITDVKQFADFSLKSLLEDKNQDIVETNVDNGKSDVKQESSYEALHTSIYKSINDFLSATNNVLEKAFNGQYVRSAIDDSTKEFINKAIDSLILEIKEALPKYETKEQVVNSLLPSLFDNPENINRPYYQLLSKIEELTVKNDSIKDEDIESYQRSLGTSFDKRINDYIDNVEDFQEKNKKEAKGKETQKQNEDIAKAEDIVISSSQKESSGNASKNLSPILPSVTQQNSSTLQTVNTAPVPRPSLKDQIQKKEMTDLQKLFSVWDSKTLRNRVNMVARDFKQAVEETMEELKEKWQEDLKEAKKDKNIFAINILTNKLKDMEDPVKGSQLAIREVTLNGMLNKVCQLYKDNIEYIEGFDEEDYEDNNDFLRNQYQLEQNKLILDNFKMLIKEANPLIENLCYIKLEDIAEEDENSDKENNANGNEGWGIKARQMDPHDTVSSKTKAVLRNLFDKDPKTGGTINDDMGATIYVDEQYAHATLLNEMKDLKDPKEFCIKTQRENGTVYWKLPALEKMAKKYKWVRQIINEYCEDGETISALYHDLRQDWLPYYGADEGLSFKAYNKSSGKELFMSELEGNFSKGVKVNDDVIFDQNGDIDEKKLNKQGTLIGRYKDGFIKLNQELSILKGEDLDPWGIEYRVNEALRVLEAASLKYKTSIANTLSKAVSAFGVNVNSESIDSVLTQMNNAARNISEYIGLGIEFVNDEVGTEGEYDEHDLEEVKKVLEDFIQAGETLYNMWETVEQAHEAIKGGKWGSSEYEYFNKKPKEDAFRYIADTTTQFNKIAEIYGQFMPQKNMHMFKIGTQSYSSFSTPNYIQTLIKNLGTKTKGACRDFIKRNFQNIDFFYKKRKGFRGSYGEDKCWLELIMDDDDIRENLEVVNVVRSNGLEYNEWDDDMIDLVNFSAYYGAPDHNNKKFGYYNMNIFSDSQCALFVKGPRFERDIYNNPEAYKDKIITLLSSAVTQEMSRIRMCQDAEEHPLSAVNDLYPRGTEFCFFPFLNTYTDIYNGITTSFTAHYSLLVKDKGEDAAFKYIKSVMAEYMQSECEKYCNEGRVAKFMEWMNTAAKEKPFFDVGDDKDAAIELMEEFFYNRYYASNQLIQLTTTDPAFYPDDIQFQKRYKEVYAHGNRLNTQSRYGKETANVVYIKDSKIHSQILDQIKERLEKAVSEHRMTEEQKDNLIDTYCKINATDGQAYRSLSSYRSVLDMMGKWDDMMEKAYQNIKNDVWDLQDINLVMQPIKDFVYTQTILDAGFDNKKVKAPVQFKNSEVPLLAMYEMIAGPLSDNPKLRALSQFMENNDIDMVEFESAVKVGKYNVIDLNINEDEHGQSDTREEDYLALLKDSCLRKEGEIGGPYTEAVHQIDYNDYMIASPTPEHIFDAKSVVGSQLRSIIPSRVPKNGVTVKGKHYTKKEFQELYKNIYIENAIERYKEVTGKFEDIESLQKFLTEMMSGNPRYGRDLQEALEIIDVEDPDNPGSTIKTFNIPLHDPVLINQVDSLFTSAFKNAIAKERMNGAACILQADYTNTLKIVFNEDGKKDSGIKYAEVYMPWHSKKAMTPFLKEKTDSDGNKYMEVDYDKIKMEAPELLEAVGCRIPTEDLYSMVPLRIKAFLPQQYGSVIIMPSDFTAIAGSDFDVDKLFILLKEFTQQYDVDKVVKVYNSLDFKTKVTQEGIEDFLKDRNQNPQTKEFVNWFNDNKDRFLTLSVVKYDQEKDPAEQSMAARNNMFIDMCYSVITAPENTSRFFNVGSFDTIKKIGYITDVMNDKRLLEEYCAEHKIAMDDIKKIRKTLESDKNLKTFIFKHAAPFDPQSLDTWKHFHKQNMAGASLIGFYAINRISQAKFLGKKMTLKTPVFIDGKKLDSVSIEYDDKNNDIAKACAEFVASSVDNAKDPTLAKLHQNKNTAPVTSFLLKAGVSIENIGYLFNHPTIKAFADQPGFLTNIHKAASKLKSSNTASINIDSVVEDIIKGTEDYGSELILFFDAIKEASELNSNITQINRADSPSGGAASDNSGLFEQVLRAEQLASRFADKDYLEKISPLDIDSSIVIKTDLVNENDDVDSIRKKLRNTSISQTAFTLGIDMIRKHVRKFNPMYNTKTIAKFLYEEFGAFYFNENFNSYKKGLFDFYMSKSTLFGDDKEKTFYEKREFYLKRFPSMVKSLMKKADYNQYSVIKALAVKKGEIILNASSRKMKTNREIYMSDFDSMILSKNPNVQKLALDLFAYSFYTEGFHYGPNNFGRYFSPFFKNQIPEYLRAEREMAEAIYNDGKESKKIDPVFFKQFMDNNWKTLIQKTVSLGKGVSRVINNDNSSIRVTNEKCFNAMTLNPYNYIKLYDNPQGYYVLTDTNKENSTYTLVTVSGDVFGNLYNGAEPNIEVLKTKALKRDDETDLVLNALLGFGGQTEESSSPSNTPPSVDADLAMFNNPSPREVDENDKQAYFHMQEMMERENYDPANNDANEILCQQNKE